MPKRRITRRQAERIANIQEKRRRHANEKAKAELDDLQTSDLGPEKTGLLIAHFGSMADVEDDQGEHHRCLLRQHLGILVPGDRVTWQSAPSGGIVVALNKRQSILGRPDQQGKMKPVAANIDQMLIVTAPEPLLITTLLDSYLIAAETLHIKPIIVLNKIDLLSTQQHNQIEQQIELYKNLGYNIVEVSAVSEHGLDNCLTVLQDKTSVFVGQSGVGKSSIISSLLPKEDIRTQALSAATGQGSHTTTTSRLYHLTHGGDLIDSPGIREFGLWHMSPEEVANGFIEFQPYLNQCKFRNCQHDQEPQCAILRAVDAGEIAKERLENFHKIITSVRGGAGP